VESWKRKESKIADTWLMRDFEDPTLEREEFKAAIWVDPETKSTEKVSRFNTFNRQVYVGIPISLFFIFAVIGTQVVMKVWSDKNVEDYGLDIPLHLKFTPAIINVGLIFVYGAVYKIVAKILVDRENHRYETAYEDSLINKMYMFQFINSYISNYIIAYWVRDFGTLVTNLIVIMVFKQIGANIAEWMMDKILIGRKIKKVKAHFQSIQPKEGGKLDVVIETEELRMHCHIEEQLVMAPASDTLIFFYNEAIIQLGFIVFFACVFPLAPLFSFLTNLLEIRIKLNRMSSYSRRFLAQGASGIGSWTGVMELISLVSIPINVGILLFTTNGKDELGEFEYSATVKFFMERDKSRTLFEVVLILVLVEHVLLGIKVIMAQLIPDVPRDVLKDERTRPKVMDLASAEMSMLKRDADLQTIEEMMEEVARNNKKLAEDEVAKELARVRRVDVDPDNRAAKKRAKARIAGSLHDIQEMAMKQQKKINKLDKANKNRLRRAERSYYESIKNDRGVINLGEARMLKAGGDLDYDDKVVFPNDVNIDFVEGTLQGKSYAETKLIQSMEIGFDDEELPANVSAHRIG
jgi:hypothetical protein